MKDKIIILLLLFLPAILYGADKESTSIPKIGLFKKLFCKLSWEEVKQTVNTPKEAAGIVRRNVRYEEDIGDIWTSAKETWQRGYGDCEDIAIAITELVRAIGGDASVAVLYNDKKGIGHAIVYGKWNDKFWFASNGFYYKARSLEDAVKIVRKEMDWRDGEITIETFDHSRQSEMVVSSHNKMLLPIYQKK